VSFLTPAEYHDLVLERLEADVIFSLDPLYKQLPLPVRTIPREELDAMSTFSYGSELNDRFGAFFPLTHYY